MGAGLLLAVETATTETSVALLRGEALVAEVAGRDERNHSARLLPILEQVLDQAGVGLDEIEAFAVSIGPGSFTGLRIGLATVKGLAFGSPRPVAAVSTLAALALAAEDAPGPVAALLDARRGEVYAGLYPGPGEGQGSERVCTPEELAGELPEGCTVVVGEGAEAAAARLEGLGAACVGHVPARASAVRVGRLGQRLLGAGPVPSAESLVPRYLRRAEAEVRRTGERFEPAR